MKIPGAVITINFEENGKTFVLFFLNIFHVLLNKEWFSGISFAVIPLYIKLIVGLFALVNLCLIIAYYFKKRTDQFFPIVTFLLCLLILLLIPASFILKEDPKYIEFSFICYCAILVIIVPSVLNRQVLRRIFFSYWIKVVKCLSRINTQ